ncbi:PIG-L deacetylase family protein [Haloarcula salinisoli]|uniref:PIG-L family deacetylase n=1 Tax=Haloarcula salinisoli TaxID=2487746 RepID=A0A8J7YCH9_9EURY|nr:PIG-L deacetylase family protein [Halomicroarcula salinisoli]MBX0285624.1 PIG-L family deacetylase [Halomicroarcula salinisoli]MBX0302887.1 PIG-L family deacetylase [Halomicroarcula salinisoli]
MQVAAIGAHPDDIEIGAGASIAVHRNRGDAVRFIILTNGGKVAAQSQRRAEAERAAEILNVDDVHFLDYADTEVPYNQETVDELEAKLTAVDPDRVYIHAEEDTHQDHRRAAKASITASRNVNQVLAFEAPSTRSSFAPQYYNSVPEGVIEGKIEAIRSHESQQEKKYLEAEAMKGLARFRGRQANSTYAEAFQVIRINNMYKSNFYGSR